MHPLPVLTPDQAAQWDRAAEAGGMPSAALMENAGRAVVAVLCDRLGDRLRQGVLVACGSGNNGGDGWVAARALHRLGVPVWVAALPPGDPGTLAGRVAGLARGAGVREVAPDGPWPAAGVLVDAILGTGARGAPRGAARALADRLADLDLPLVAVDGPTGLDLLDGVQHGPVRATLTVTFGGCRRGHLLARDEVGDLVITDIGFPPPDPAWPILYTDRQAIETLPALRAADHKGTRGRVVVVGGSPGLTGAARLAARAAFGAGAGLVHVVAPPASVAVLAAAEPDVQTCAQAFDAPLDAAALALLDRADAVIVGPGLGLQPGRHELVRDVVARSAAVVIDADALSAFAGRADHLADCLRGKAAVVTPHLGEFRGLAPDLAAGAAVDPWLAAGALAERLDTVVLLKGVPTVVARRGAAPVTVAAGNPGLATGGSGDTLSGLIGTFLAQQLEALTAASLGAQVLGRAADLAAMRLGARALRPMDVSAALPDLWRGWGLAARALDRVRPPVVAELERPRHL